jgi:subtilisin family serine protease
MHINLIKIFIIFFVIAFSTFKTPHTQENVTKSLFVKNHLIVKLKIQNHLLAAGSLENSDGKNIILNKARDCHIRIIKMNTLFPASRKLPELYEKFELEKFYVIEFEGSKPVTDLCKEFEKDPNIEFTEPDYIGHAAGIRGIDSQRPNDEYFKRQWGLDNDGSQKTATGKQGKLHADMNVLKGWEITTGSEDVIVAILDSGVKLDHPDLEGKIWINNSETKNGRDDDANGYIDDIYGWNFAYENSNVKDDGGHGTNIAGTIGASTNNTIGYAGLDQKCKLMICKNLDDDNLGEYSWWASSLYYAANNGAKVINMSEGGYDYSKTLKTAVDYAYSAGCLIVASMMNKNNNDSYYPASFPNVLAIGATDTDDSRCKQFTWGGGSNWGKHIAVVAPGNRIYGLDYKDNYNYDVYWSGTSQATAYVSAISSLLLAQDNTRANKDLKEIITSTAKDQVGDKREDKPGWDEYYGWGRVDLFAALTLNKDQVEDKNKDVRDDTKIPDINKQEDDDFEKDRKAKAIGREADTKKDNEDDKHRAKPVREY